MSQLLKQNAQFLRLLLTTSPSQARALLKTATHMQLAVLRKVALNLNCFPVDQNSLNVPKKFWRLFEKLSKKPVSLHKPRIHLARNADKYLIVLRFLKDYVEMLLE